MDELIEIRNMCKIYNPGENEVRALDHVDLQIDRHEFVAIIGQSGSGKSTLMKILFGLLPKSSGEIQFDGISKGKQSLGALIEAPAIYHNLSAFDNLKTKALLYDIPARPYSFFEGKRDDDSGF